VLREIWPLWRLPIVGTKPTLELKDKKNQIVDKKRIKTILKNIRKKSIKNKIDPGKSFDKDLYALSENEVKKVPTVCGSLREAMESLDRDRDFLKQGNVFTDDQIDAYIALKFEEIHNFEHTPHPIEFDMYYSC